MRVSSLIVLVGAASSIAVSSSDAQSKARICLIPTAVESSAHTGNAVEAVRVTFAAFLTGPSVSTQPIEARLASQAREEAQLAGCPFLLLTTLKHTAKRSGGLLGQLAAGAVRQGAYEAGAASGNVGGRIAGSAVSAAAHQAAVNYAIGIRNHDEITLGWRLEASDGKVLGEGKDKKKAQADGEDLLSPLVQDASERVLDAAKRGAK